MKKLMSIILFLVLCLSPTVLADGWFFSGGVSTCDVASNEVGNRDTEATTFYVGSDTLRCNLKTPDCTGKLYTAYAYAVATGDNVKVLVYTDDGDSAPDSGDSLLISSGAISSSSSGAWFSDALGSNPNVSTGTNYWVCLVTDATEWGCKYGSEAPDQRYQNIVGSYASPPSDLSGSWGSNSDRHQSTYVTIGD